MKNFDSLSLDRKVALIVKEGIHLETASSSIYQADLYCLRGKFVEVLMLPCTRDFVHVRSASDDVLDKYLSSVHLAIK